MSASSVTEKIVKSHVKTMLKKHDAYYFMPVQSGYGAPGLDFHGCHKGRAFAIETKKPGKKPTPRQKLTMMEMEEAGMKVFVIAGSTVEFIELETWLLGLLS